MKSEDRRPPSDLLERVFGSAVSGRVGWMVYALLAAATVVRLAYGLAINDPLSGQDADTYHAAAAALAERGWFASDVPGIPYWPAGYPAFVAVFYELFGIRTGPVVVAQVLALGFGTLVLYRLIDREIGRAEAVGSVVLLSLSPAFIAAPSLLMYEVVLGVLLVVAVDQVSKLRFSGRLVDAGAAGTAMAVASAVQPKVLPVAMLVGVWVLWKDHGRLTPVLVMLTVTLAGPVLLGACTYIADGRFALAATLGPTMAIGFNPDATGGYAPETAARLPCRNVPDDMFDRDRRLIACSLRLGGRPPIEDSGADGEEGALLLEPDDGTAGGAGHLIPRLRLPPCVA